MSRYKICKNSFKSVCCRCGQAKVSVHTYNVNPDVAKDEAVRLFIETQQDLKNKGVKVLEA
jgi:hypothetical protein